MDSSFFKSGQEETDLLAEHSILGENNILAEAQALITLIQFFRENFKKCFSRHRLTLVNDRFSRLYGAPTVFFYILLAAAPASRWSLPLRSDKSIKPFSSHIRGQYAYVLNSSEYDSFRRQLPAQVKNVVQVSAIKKTSLIKNEVLLPCQANQAEMIDNHLLLEGFNGKAVKVDQLLAVQEKERKSYSEKRPIQTHFMVAGGKGSILGDVQGPESFPSSGSASSERLPGIAEYIENPPLPVEWQSGPHPDTNPQTRNKVLTGSSTEPNKPSGKDNEGTFSSASPSLISSDFEANRGQVLLRNAQNFNMEKDPRNPGRDPNPVGPIPAYGGSPVREEKVETETEANFSSQEESRLNAKARSGKKESKIDRREVMECMPPIATLPDDIFTFSASSVSSTNPRARPSLPRPKTKSLRAFAPSKAFQGARRVSRRPILASTASTSRGRTDSQNSLFLKTKSPPFISF